MVDSIQITSLGFSLFFFFFPSFIRRGPLALPSPCPRFSPPWSFLVDIHLFFLPDPRLHCCLSSPSSPATLLSPIPSSFLSFSFTFSLFTFYICILTRVCLDSTTNGHCYIPYRSRNPLTVPEFLRNINMEYKIAVFFSSYQHKERHRDVNIKDFSHLLSQDRNI